ncbi:hypothetical protein ACIP98_21255 [Streptomyces sp. NPDC088354]|uniref:zinc finger domain-containing protein n=1 Tax=Streptomyces sp. NPDC088354 TaxID=3365856 RepID=UPI0037F9E859
MTGRPLRWPELAVACSWCHAQPEALCTNQRGTREKRDGTHEQRRAAWVIAHVACPDCEQPVGAPCRAATAGLTLTGVHASRDAEAVRTQPAARTPRVEALGDQLSIPPTS